MKLYVIGIGPGGRNQMTGRAIAAIHESDVIAGYTTYIDLIKNDFAGKALLATPMRQEVQRCRAAVEEAVRGRTVAMVCSGDAGVYGMAGLVYQVAQDYSPIEIEVIPGVTAACSGAAVLGAPLMHDFAIISLSDLLTPWETIARRLDLAAQGGFILCLYNPSSKKRADYLRRACDILLRHRGPQTVCGWVCNAGRPGEKSRVLSLGEMRGEQVDMFTTVYIGNSQTQQIGGKMVTPRGYPQV